jgi:hypothetical protein
MTTDGMLAVTGIPGFASLRQKVLTEAHECLQRLPEKIARGHTFEDGTERRTLAMTTADEAANLPSGTYACSGFQSTQKRFRDLIGEVTHAFVKNLDRILDIGDDPLLESESGMPYSNVEEIFQRGEHLEHVHSYHLPREHQGSHLGTMDFHTDQGLCIAFTPALLVRAGENGVAVVETGTAATGRFEVQLSGGERAEVDFSTAELVLMLGDGVNQYVNPKKLSGPDLRAVPHALTMPSHASDEWRVWYGRMFMAPKDGITQHGMSHGEMRDMLTEAWVTEEDSIAPQLAFGCSGGMHARELRELSSAPPCSSGARRRCSGSCANNQKQCWWRCMNFTEIESTCGAKDMAWNCTNLRDEISHGMHHGGYDLRCTAKTNTQLVRGNCDASFDRLNVGLPATCSAVGYESFLNSTLAGYAGRHDLSLDQNGKPEVVFKWSVVDGKVEGAMAFNGKVSWLALGLENLAEDSGKNGMMGAKVIFGISSLDKEFSNHTGTVQEYKIHDYSSRFGSWKTPIKPASLENTAMIEENCYTAMKFKTAAIAGELLKVTSGTNRLIWAARASTYMHVGKDSYHEGCSGEERTRYRGGGRNAPWIIDFQNTATVTLAPKATTTTIIGEPLSRTTAYCCSCLVTTVFLLVTITQVHG